MLLFFFFSGRSRHKSIYNMGQEHANAPSCMQCCLGSAVCSPRSTAQCLFSQKQHKHWVGMCTGLLNCLV